MADGGNGSNWRKARFYNADTNTEVVECQFNPNDFTITRTNTWTPGKGAGAGLPTSHFGGMGARSLQLNLVFDSIATRGDVTKLTNLLASLMEAPPGSKTAGKT